MATTIGSAVLGQHTAAPQFAGYLYQVQLTILRLFDLEEGTAIGVEILDDLHVERDGEPVELGQSKHHQGGRPASLADGSPDLWKTIGTWAAAISCGDLRLDTIERLLLITTAAAPAGSIAALIASGGPLDEIVARLRAFPRPVGERLGRAHDAVFALTDEQLRNLVARLAIHADQPHLAETPGQVRELLRRAGFHPRTLDDAAQEISGWAWEAIVARLGTPGGVLLGEDEFRAALRYIRDGLVEGVLPARFVSATVDEAEFLGQQSATYLRQLALIGATNPVKRRAVLNHFRANSERTRWVERLEILPERLREFDRELVERWEPAFEAICDGLTGEDDELALQRRGLEHFRSIEQTEVPIDPRWIHRYLTVGSYHRLADCLRVGWHPHFHDRLAGAPGAGETGGNDA